MADRYSFSLTTFSPRYGSVYRRDAPANVHLAGSWFRLVTGTELVV